MSDAPDRIIVSSHGLSYSVKATHTTAFKNVEYIRADLYEDLEVAYSQQGNYKLLYEARQLILEMPENEQAERIAELEAENRKLYTDNAGLLLANERLAEMLDSK